MIFLYVVYLYASVLNVVKGKINVLENRQPDVCPTVLVSTRFLNEKSFEVYETNNFELSSCIREKVVSGNNEVIDIIDLF